MGHIKCGIDKIKQNVIKNKNKIKQKVKIK